MERRIFEKIIEGILCKGWNLYLSKNNYNEFYKFLNNIFKEKNIEFSIEKKLFGRTQQKEVIVINIANREYILPRFELTKKTIEDICLEDYKYIFYLNGKYLPRGIPNGEIDELYLNYKNTLKFDTYYDLLDELYSEDTISIVLERSIKKDINFQEYSDLIDESIKLYLKNKFTGAISILLPCIEGILRKIINSYSGIDNYYKEKNYLQKAQKEVLKKWGAIIYPKSEVWFHPELEKDNKYLYLFDKLAIIINGFFKYLESFFYGNIDDFIKDYPNENLNRHSIVHGYTLDYGKKENYLLLFGMLDFLLLLSNFELWREGHNYKSYIKAIEYKYIRNTVCPIDFKLNHKEILINHLELIKILLIESLDELEKLVLKNSWIKKFMKETLKNEISKKINSLYFIPFFAYTLIFDYEKESILLKYNSKDFHCSSQELELNIFEISFTEDFERKNSYIYFFINLNNKEIKSFIDNNIL